MSEATQAGERLLTPTPTRGMTMLSKEKAVDRQMSDSVAERVASEATKPIADFLCSKFGMLGVDFLAELDAVVVSTLTADNAAKDAEIATLRTELTALREAAEVAKKRVAISRDLLAGNLNKGASRDDVADLYSRWANIEKQLSAAISPAADEPIVVGGKVCKFYLNQFNRFKGRWSIHSGTYHMHLGQWTCKTDERDHFLTEQFARDFARQCAAKE